MFSIYFHLILFGFGCLLLHVLAKPQLNEDCELNAADTMHDFCCELHEESSEFTECQMDWFSKLEPNNEQLEQAYMFCTAECAFNATEYLAGNRQSLNLRRIKEHLEDELDSKAEQKQLYETYVKCDKHALSLLRHKGVQAIAKHLTTHGCHVYPGLVLECVANEMILHCPAERFSKVAQCRATRDYLRQCFAYLKYKT
ncbi:uncharacterized protein LOC133845540 [Drosophila sulfurigaster albostrigata]|uniref:uncharacterized protein LOC133845540 n=1 Tax=Drosophila sulfurigaster albostrigata TaxID=89887 RepID=UPI002D21A6C9|nr:uncharacterized protein LOC133845540 [Drosophila sulfurigaster albostrigata]